MLHHSGSCKGLGRPVILMVMCQGAGLEGVCVWVDGWWCHSQCFIGRYANERLRDVKPTLKRYYAVVDS